MFARSFRFALLAGIGLGLGPTIAAAAETAKPNVLFIAIDDLRDWVGYLGNPQVKTPNLDRLAQRGVSFTHSYCAAPVCNPSRTALLSGFRPGSSGVYENRADWRKIIPDVVTLPLHFKKNGYYVAGAGKIYHGAFPRLSDWDEFIPQVPPQTKRRAIKSNAANDGVGGIKFKPLQCDDADMVDHGTVNYALKQLGQKHDKPFFLACGLHKPHMPWDVPQKYYDMYPLDKIELPAIKEDDLKDVPPSGIRMAKPQGDHAAMLKSGRWKEAVQAYLATITFMDTEVGRLLDGFDRSPNKDNTIICFWSDHGWHLGEKQHWRKFALWEEATRSPLIFVVPGMTKPNSVCRRTVDFMSLYPTLCDLCGLPVPEHVQGVSIRPLLANPDAAWDRPAVTTYLPNNHAVRTERWRYIRYRNGDEELYDHDADPHEWKNLAKEPQFAEVKQELGKWLPRENKEEIVTEPAAKQGKKKKKN
jgi:arylsulfatase A-like enzyme